LPYDEEVGRALKDVKWRTINELFKNYRLVERYIKEELRRIGVAPERVDSYVASVMESLGRMRFEKPQHGSAIQ
jgi:hypothetical protein